MPGPARRLGYVRTVAPVPAPLSENRRLLFAVVRFELARYALGHTAVISGEQLEAWVLGEQPFTLNEYRVAIEAAWEEGKDPSGYLPDPVLPGVFDHSVEHTTCTGGTKLHAGIDGFTVERHGEPLDAICRTDHAVLAWLTGASLWEAHAVNQLRCCGVDRWALERILFKMRMEEAGQ